MRYCYWCRSLAPRITRAWATSTWTATAAFGGARRATSRPSCSPASRWLPSVCCGTRRKGRSRPTSCGTERSRKGAALAPCTTAFGSMSARRSRSRRRKQRCRMPEPAAERPAVFTIPGHRSFADSLAAGLIQRFGGEPLGLAKGRLLLPNNRAVRAVTDAFVRASGQGLLLPRLIPIGDPQLGERIGGILEAVDDEPIAPAIEPLERILLLASLARRSEESASEALRVAAEVGRTLDALKIE